MLAGVRGGLQDLHAGGLLGDQPVLLDLVVDPPEARLLDRAQGHLLEMRERDLTHRRDRAPPHIRRDALLGGVGVCSGPNGLVERLEDAIASRDQRRRVDRRAAAARRHAGAEPASVAIEAPDDLRDDRTDALLVELPAAHDAPPGLASRALS